MVSLKVKGVGSIVLILAIISLGYSSYMLLTAPQGERRNGPGGGRDATFIFTYDDYFRLVGWVTIAGAINAAVSIVLLFYAIGIIAV